MDVDLALSPLRHRRVWLRSDLPVTGIQASDQDAVHTIVGWAGRGLPFVGRSRLEQDGPGIVPLGMAWAEAGRRWRLSFGVEQGLVERIEPPMTLYELLPGIPERMRDDALRLAIDAATCGVTVGVYGSIFWEHLSAGYVHADSDLDLIARPPSLAALNEWLRTLREVDARSSMRVDGEIESPSGGAVAWRELAGGVAQILVKADSGPRLLMRTSFLAEWKEAAHT
jgi:phosphoribosyl-dephospho-CoA transferase